MTQKVYFNNFRGGLSIDDLPLVSSAQPREKMQLNQLSLADNIIILPDGKVKTRCGFRHLTNNPSGAEVLFAIPYNSTDVYVAAGGILWRFRTIGAGSGWTSIVNPFLYTSGEVMNGKIYFFGSTEIGEFNPATGAITPIVGSTGIVRCHTVANDRMWLVQDASPLVVEGSAVGDPTDWANGVANEIPTGSVEINAIIGLDRDLWVFCNDAIWLQTGYSESDFTLDFFVACSTYLSFQRSFTQATLIGFGKCVVFCDDSGRVKAVNRSGLIEVCRSVGKIINHDSFTGGVFLEDSGIFLMNQSYGLVAIFCNLPYKDAGGMIQWPVTSFKPAISTWLANLYIFSARLKLTNASETGNKQFCLICAITGSLLVQYPLFTFAQEDVSTDYYFADDYLPGISTASYFQVQGKIRLPPFNAKTDKPKTWHGFTISTNVPGDYMTTFTLTQYMDRTMQYPQSITGPATPYVFFGLYGYTEWIQLEFAMFGTTAGRATAYNHLMEIHEMMLEYS